MNQRYQLKNYPILLDIPCNDEGNKIVKLDEPCGAASTYNAAAHTKTNKVAVSG
jgi:hypothetical protein